MSSRGEGALHRFPLGDAVVCLDRRRDRVHLANAVGADIWWHRARGDSLDETVRALGERYDVAPERLAADVRACAAALDAGAEFEIRPMPDYVPLHEPPPARPPHVSATRSVLHLPGVRVRLRCEAARVARELERLFPLGPSRGTEDLHELAVTVYAERDRFPIVHGGETLDVGLAPGDAVVKCLREIGGLAARRGRSRRSSSTAPDGSATVSDGPSTATGDPPIAILHAAAVARDGAGVLLPAVGGSGKTTLAAWLATRGFRVLNDDAVPVLAEGGRLRAVPLALSIKAGSWPVLAPAWPAIDALPVHGREPLRVRYLPLSEGQACHEDVPCRLIALPRYDATTVGASWQPLAPAEVFRELVEGGCIVERPLDPAQVGALVAWLGDKPCARLVYGDLEAAREALERGLRAAGGVSPPA